MHLLPNERLGFLNTEQTKALCQLSERYPDKLTWRTHELCRVLGVDAPTAMLVMATLDAEGFADQMLVVCHTCDEEHVIRKYPVEVGFPKLPIECPECQNDIESSDELRFDFEAKLKETIRCQ